MRAELRQQDDVMQTRNSCYLCLKEIIWGDQKKSLEEYDLPPKWRETIKQKHPLPWLRIWWWGRGTELGWSRSFKRGAWARVEPAHPPAPGAFRTSICQDSAKSLVRAHGYLPLGCWWNTLKKNQHLQNRSSLLPEPELSQHICSGYRWG